MRQGAAPAQPPEALQRELAHRAQAFERGLGRIPAATCRARRVGPKWDARGRLHAATSRRLARRSKGAAEARIPTVSHRSRARRHVYVAAAVAWIAALIGGFAILLHYSMRAGPSRSAPAALAGAAARASGRFELAVFLHPQCPCSRATVDELARIAERSGDRLHVRAWFVADRALGEAWTRAALWERAQRIPGIELAEDFGAAKAMSMGAETSGTVLLYAPDGRLAYSGGITRARGHAGDNPGADAVVDLVHGRAVERNEFEVFGCSLRDADIALEGP